MSRTEPTTVADLTTPALLVDRHRFDRNVATMAAVHPGPRLRPHVKAFKSTALATRLAEAGHRSFCAATVAEIEGMAGAGLIDDLLLANEVVDHRRLGPLVADGASITVAVDSPETIESAVAGGVRSVLVDVDVGLPRCGCQVGDAGSLADLARSRGLEVRGVMGYEGHLMMVMDPDEKRDRVGKAMGRLLEAHEAVGGDIVSAGGSGTYAVNTWANEIQAGSYCLMDTQYATLDLPFEIALSVVATVISVNTRGWFVVDAGLKAFGMDHGNPTSRFGEVMFCSDEHTTIRPDDRGMPAVGDRIALLPAHVDPTVAKHRQFWVVDGRTELDLADRPIVDRWPIDLRHW
jgi:D-serine deaminase-like pyridoxal phosphate-dependent protein